MVCKQRFYLEAYTIKCYHRCNHTLVLLKLHKNKNIRYPCGRAAQPFHCCRAASRFVFELRSTAASVFKASLLFALLLFCFHTLSLLRHVCFGHHFAKYLLIQQTKNFCELHGHLYLYFKLHVQDRIKCLLKAVLCAPLIEGYEWHCTQVIFVALQSYQKGNFAMVLKWCSHHH